MPWIEGIGDEVTITVGLLVGICILMLAWVSTGIRDIPFISVIIVQLTRRRVVPNTDGNSSANQSSTDQPEGSISSPNVLNSEDAHETEPAEVSETSESRINPENHTEPVAASITDRNVPASSGLKVEADNSGSSVDAEDKSLGTDISDRTNRNVNDSISDQVSLDDHEPAPCPVSSAELRQRRLNFFSGISVGKSSCSNVPVSISGDNGSEQTNHSVPVSHNENSNTLSSNQQNSLPKLVSDTTSSVDGSQPVDTVNSEHSGNHSSSGSTSETHSQTGSPEAEPGKIRIRIKFLNDTQRLVTADATETIGNFRQQHFSTELSQSKLVRFIFNGQDLRNDASTLESYNIVDNSVLHCLVTQRPVEHQEQEHGDDGGLDIGIFMFPLFGALLGIVWYMRFMYRQFFNVTSTLTLGGISFLYVAALLSTLRGRRPHEHME